jgi:hypothetical protein
VPPQYDVIPRFRDHTLVGPAIDDIFSEALLRQQIDLDAKPNIIQQQEKSALIHHATACCDLDLLAPMPLGSTMAPRTVTLVRPDQPRTRIDVQFLRYPTVPTAKSSIDRNEIANMLVDVLLDGIAPIDSGTDLAEHLVPWASNLGAQVAA